MSKPIEKYSIEIEPLYQRASCIIENARATAYKQINEALVRRNWLIGQLIVEEERKGNERADYGVALIKILSKRLTEEYGKGFTKTNLYSFAKFYEFFPEIFHSVSGKCGQLLSWTHYRVVVQELNADAREWYVHEALTQNWSVRTLQRNISSQYFYRLLSSQQKELVEREMLKITAPLQTNDPNDFIKNPVVGEFLGFTADASFMESELEQSIIDNLEKFLLEMGKGFAFVARQEVNGGYIVVKNNGDVVAFHSTIADEFKDFLVAKMRMESPSHSRHKDMVIYKESDRYFLKLALQLRFTLSR